MMLDKNGREIKTGDVVRITGAFFKNDNGTYLVVHSPGDPSWSGRDYSLRKICRDGHLSTAKYNICFWPISCYVNDRVKRAVAYDWNREHAEIEIIDWKNWDCAIAYFMREADDASGFMETAGRNWGKHCHEYVKNLMIRDHYRNVVKSIC